MAVQATVLTGAGRGLGRAMALALVKAGHSVVAVDRDADVLEALGRDAPAGSGRLATLAADLTDSKSAAAIVAFSERTFGPVACLVNCAGIGQEIIRRDFATNPIKFWDVDEPTTRLIFAVNFDAVLRLCAAVAPGMVKRGWGRIVTVTTSLETMIRVGMSPYGPAKAASEALAAIIAKELQDTGVTVNILVPGGPAATRMMPEFVDTAPERLIPPEVMVAPILWLLSRASDGVTGRRFRANAWDPAIEPAAAAKAAGAPIAWSGLAGGAAQVNYTPNAAS